MSGYDSAGPMYIGLGSPLTPRSVSGDRYSFAYRTFKDAVVVNMASGKTADDYFNEETSELVVFSSAGETSMSYGDVNDIPVEATRLGFLNGESGSIMSAMVSPLTFGYNFMASRDGTRMQDVRDELHFEWSPFDENTSERFFSKGSSLCSTETFLKNAELNDFQALAIMIDNKSDVTFKAVIAQKNNASSSEASQRDDVEIKITQSACELELNKNKNSGTLAYSKQNASAEMGDPYLSKNAQCLILYPRFNALVLANALKSNDNEKPKEISVFKYSDINYDKHVDPSIEEFPAKYKEGKATCIRVKSSNLYPMLGNHISVQGGNASYAVQGVLFYPRIKFSYYYRVDGDQTTVNAAVKLTHVFRLAVGGDYQNWKGWDKEFVAKAVKKTEHQTIMRVDFDIQSKYPGYLCRRPVEILGIIHVVKMSGKLSAIRNQDGDFTSHFNRQISMKGGKSGLGRYNCGLASEGKSWANYITELSIEHSLDGSTGNITLDKYLMGDSLMKVTDQVIGALTLVANNGYYDVNPVLLDVKSTIYPSLPDGQIFKGYALEESDTANEGATTIQVSLEGIQRKLGDMCLVNCPYWDGDQLFENGALGVLNYMIDYSGCDLRYMRRLSEDTVLNNKRVNGDASHFILPQSMDWSAPCVHFSAGTPVLDALKKLAEYVNHEFVIQPDGRGYFYGLDAYGRPTWLSNGPVRKVFKAHELADFSLKPYMGNRYNTFFTMAVVGEPDIKTGQIVPRGSRPGSRISISPQDPSNYPWSRIITNREDGIVTQSQLSQFHRRNVQFGSTVVFQGSVKIQGWHGFYLFDKVALGSPDNVFYIYGLSHDFDFREKSWTTTLQLATTKTYA